MISQWKRFPFLYQFTSDKKECDECLKLLHGETRRVTQLRRSKLDAEIENKSNGSSEDNKETDGLVSKQRRPFLDSLLIAQRESGLLSDDNIQEETDTFMFGVGHIYNLFNGINIYHYLYPNISGTRHHKHSTVLWNLPAR